MKIVMSDRKCECGKTMKQSIVSKKGSNATCYKCHCKSESLRGHHINTKRREKRYEAGLPVKPFGRKPQES